MNYLLANTGISPKNQVSSANEYKRKTSCFVFVVIAAAESPHADDGVLTCSEKRLSPLVVIWCCCLQAAVKRERRRWI